MRTEAQIKEALELVKQSDPGFSHGILARDATVEALRYVLGIDDEESSPMSMPLAELLSDLKKDQEEGSTCGGSCDSQQTIAE